MKSAIRKRWNGKGQPNRLSFFASPTKISVQMDATADAKFRPLSTAPKKVTKKPLVLANKRLSLVRPMRFERTAFGVGVQRSIQLSYGRGYK